MRRSIDRCRSGNGTRKQIVECKIGCRTIALSLGAERHYRGSMGELQDVIGPHIATHPEAAYLFGLIVAIETNTLDARIERISALLRPAEVVGEPVGQFL